MIGLRLSVPPPGPDQARPGQGAEGEARTRDEPVLECSITSFAREQRPAFLKYLLFNGSHLACNSSLRRLGITAPPRCLSRHKAREGDARIQVYKICSKLDRAEPEAKLSNTHESVKTPYARPTPTYTHDKARALALSTHHQNVSNSSSSSRSKRRRCVCSIQRPCISAGEPPTW
ncbi:hypothetical protein PoB_002109800 [Plakobranchus ocellatus]|uniref:Uncharacterized protein n=1 Tax=Plakobranchus ocellatus TaxID=259542 RepID=A0AAV3ZIE9_9GAST|nr:hypothetical protein PoB_002109800 [Plakobranchus ocellatus]